MATPAIKITAKQPQRPVCPDLPAIGSLKLGEKTGLLKLIRLLKEGDLFEKLSNVVDDKFLRIL
ncbi:MAG: hypothetical protein HY762_02315, partial [Planctomycetes bacterium]|nr:hypothetical protein [Planctomycetota bacterium]